MKKQIVSFILICMVFMGINAQNGIINNSNGQADTHTHSEPSFNSDIEEFISTLKEKVQDIDENIEWENIFQDINKEVLAIADNVQDRIKEAEARAEEARKRALESQARAQERAKEVEVRAEEARKRALESQARAQERAKEVEVRAEEARKRALESQARAQERAKEAEVRAEEARKRALESQARAQERAKEAEVRAEEARKRALESQARAQTRTLEARERAVNNNLALATKDIEVYSDNVTVKGNGEIIVNNEQEYKTPTRTERQSYSGVKALEIDHSYGNITISQSKSKEVSVDIEYFDTKDEKATCKINHTNKVLSVNTIYESLTNNKNNKKKARINYIINVPENTELSISLKYGNTKMEDYRGALTANLAYSNLDANNIYNANSSIKARYSNVTIGETEKMSVVIDYGNLKIFKISNLDINGRYNNFDFDEIYSLRQNSSHYNTYKIKKIHTFKTELRYCNVTINQLESDANLDCAYSTIKIHDISKELKNLNLQGSYSDISFSLPTNLTATFEANLHYGELEIANKYKTTYTEQIKKNNKVSEKGTIGSKKPTAHISLSNKYANIKIR